MKLNLLATPCRQNQILQKNNSSTYNSNQQGRTPVFSNSFNFLSPQRIDVSQNQ